MKIDNSDTNTQKTRAPVHSNHSDQLTCSARGGVIERYSTIDTYRYNQGLKLTQLYKQIMEEQINKLFEKTMLITFCKIGADMINAIMLESNFFNLHVF